MAKRGPKPTSTNILKLRGSWRGDIKKDEITPSNKPPTMPSWLSKEAKIEWRRIIRILKSQGTLSEINRTIIAAYCECYADYLEAREYCRNMNKDGKSSIVCETKKGNIIQNPAIGIRNTALKMMLKIATELGISSIAKSRIKESKTPKEKRKERFFKKTS